MSHLRIVHLHLDIPRVDDVDDAIDRERCLSNIGRHDAFPAALWRLVKNLCLQTDASQGITLLLACSEYDVSEDNADAKHKPEQYTSCQSS